MSGSGGHVGKDGPAVGAQERAGRWQPRRNHAQERMGRQRCLPLTEVATSPSVMVAVEFWPPPSGGGGQVGPPSEWWRCSLL
jgi:hypothetical protein